MKRSNRWLAFLISILLLILMFPGAVYAESRETVVYRAKTGKYYHTQNCSALKSSYEITLQEAVNKGLSPCSKCHPPTLDQSDSNRELPAPKVLATSVFVEGTKFLVTITDTCEDFNKVGNEWSSKFLINDCIINSEDIVAFNLNVLLEISTEITENDKNPEKGEANTTHRITEKELSDGFSVYQSIVVTENAGKYAGYEAIWEVEYKFTRCE